MSCRRDVVTTFLVLICAAACRADASPPTGALSRSAEQACPPEPFLEELHAASFYFQHGPTELARGHLERARAAAPTKLDVTSTQLLAKLVAVSARIDGEPSWGQSEVENVRIALADWACLTDTAHERFHGKLPSLR